MYCNQDVDHRLLGYLCLAFALEYDGLVDFNGRLDPRPPDDVSTAVSERDRRAERDRRIAQRMRRVRGRLYVVDYGSRNNPINCHVGDAEFMDSWLRHPRFRMIK